MIKKQLCSESWSGLLCLIETIKCLRHASLAATEFAAKSGKWSRQGTLIVSVIILKYHRHNNVIRRGVIGQ